MPDHTRLRVGNRIRIIAVPAADLDQRRRERIAGNADAGCTADILERIMAQHPRATIARIGKDGKPWFDVELQNADGKPEFHSIAVSDDDSWEYV